VPAESYFHVGMVVPALEPALAELGTLLGLTWQPTIEVDVPVHPETCGDDRGDGTVHLRFAYSNESPQLEVIEAAPGTPWELSEGSNLHHLGFCTDDLAADSDRFAASGCPMQVCMRSADGQHPVAFSYHRGLGIRFELVERAAADAFRR